ncbi:hypothetical protein CAOG_06856 [Capsaspora owczarzaki ATCC 30864]|nr:hypothetical protein CAOG_06856 [Capsaspora owczarzaki ATCC 30864]|eukprot:XP_004344477.1 hypothetical protein CAOG_06856 [Capsaspora owczarzaki ATCC 30864]
MTSYGLRVNPPPKHTTALASINPNKPGWTALHFAIYSKRWLMSVCTWILKSATDHPASQQDGSLPAVLHDSLAALRLTVTAAALDSSKVSCVPAVFRAAIFRWNSAFVSHLASHCPASTLPRDSQDSDGWAPLHLSADVGDEQGTSLLASLLRAQMEEANREASARRYHHHPHQVAVSEQQDSTLGPASEQNREFVTRLLRSGFTPMHLAMARGFPQIVNVIERVLQGGTESEMTSLRSLATIKDSFGRPWDLIDVRRTPWWWLLYPAKPAPVPPPIVTPRPLPAPPPLVFHGLAWITAKEKTQPLLAEASGPVDLVVEDASRLCDFDVRDAAQLTRRQFERNYLHLRRPLLIKGGVANWPAIAKWTNEHLLHEFGDRKFVASTIPYAAQYNLQDTRITLRDFLNGSHATGSEQGTMAHCCISCEWMPADWSERLTRLGICDKCADALNHSHSALPVAPAPPLYIFDNTFINAPPGVAGSLAGSRRQAFLNNDVVAPTWMEDHSMHAAQFMFGPCLSGAPVHFHTDAWNGLIRGRKRWFVFAPGASFISKEPVLEWFRREEERQRMIQKHGEHAPATFLECIQEAGDLMYIPDSYGHGVINMQESLAIAVEFVNRA